MRTEKQTAKSLAGEVFYTLREDLLNGRIPAGERVNIAALRTTYDVGLSPLREALSRLAATGLLEQQNQRGYFAPKLTRTELADIVQLRTELEIKALRASIETGDAQWESEVLAAGHRLKSMDQETDKTRQWEVLHKEFHAVLLSRCGSPWTLRFINQLHDQFDRYRRQAPFNKEVRQRLNLQHDELVRLALARRTEEICELVEDHIRLSAEVAVKAV